MIEIGAFPFLIKKGKLYIMLVTNTSGDSWILPKGHPEPDLKNARVAELETYEEAGVIGEVLHKSQYQEFKREQGGALLIYPLQIEEILDTWKEASIRKRCLVKVKEALQLVTKKEHLNAIKYFICDKNIKQMVGLKGKV